jgi:RNA polymerase sigma-54 factor
MLRKPIDAEDTRKPLSDQAIAKALQSKGIQVARRTVAKYRESLRIPSSSERQRAR